MTNKEILNNIYTKSNKLDHFALKIDFYINKNILDVYHAIFNNTAFLNNTDASLRERIFYIENNYNDIQRCIFCDQNKLKFARNKLCFAKSCKDASCLRKRRSISNTGNRSVPRIIKNCIGCNTIFKHLPSENRKYCSQSCWTSHNNSPRTDEQRRKISETNKKTHNSLEFKEKTKEIYQQSWKKISKTMKQKIQDGVFTPCITNSWTKRSAFVEINGIKKKFRSNWEASFWVLNQHLQYEQIRIPYYIDGNKHLYIVDFVDVDNKILYEIKPESLVDTPKNISKHTYAKSWCQENNYEYFIISNNWFLDNVNNIDFNTHPNLKPYMQQFIIAGEIFGVNK